VRRSAPLSSRPAVSSTAVELQANRWLRPSPSSFAASASRAASQSKNVAQVCPSLFLPLHWCAPRLPFPRMRRFQTSVQGSQVPRQLQPERLRVRPTPQERPRQQGPPTVSNTPGRCKASCGSCGTGASTGSSTPSLRRKVFSADNFRDGVSDPAKDAFDMGVRTFSASALDRSSTPTRPVLSPHFHRTDGHLNLTTPASRQDHRLWSQVSGVPLCWLSCDAARTDLRGPARMAAVQLLLDLVCIQFEAHLGSCRLGAS